MAVSAPSSSAAQPWGPNLTQPRPTLPALLPHPPSLSPRMIFAKVTHSPRWPMGPRCPGICPRTSQWSFKQGFVTIRHTKRTAPVPTTCSGSIFTPFCFPRDDRPQQLRATSLDPSGWGKGLFDSEMALQSICPSVSGPQPGVLPDLESQPLPSPAWLSQGPSPRARPARQRHLPLRFHCGPEPWSSQTFAFTGFHESR